VLARGLATGAVGQDEKEAFADLFERVKIFLVLALAQDGPARKVDFR
jgi:hypothetical protein